MGESRSIFVLKEARKTKQANVKKIIRRGKESKEKKNEGGGGR